MSIPRASSFERLTPAAGSATFQQVVNDTFSSVLESTLGPTAYQRVQSIRRTAKSFRAAGDGAAARALQGELHALMDVELPLQLNIIRAFSYYSHLLNIAERQFSASTKCCLKMRLATHGAVDCKGGGGGGELVMAV